MGGFNQTHQVQGKTDDDRLWTDEETSHLTVVYGSSDSKGAKFQSKYALGGHVVLPGF